MMKHRPFVLLDIETTGGSAKYARITEIGALRIEEGTVVAEYKQLINPEVPIPYFITKLTRITNEMAWQSPTFTYIATELEELLNGAIFVAHHVAFDYSFIKAEFERIGIQYNSDRLCSVKLSRILHPEQGRHSLDNVIERLNIKVSSRHRAFDDAEVIWKFFQDEYRRSEVNFFRAINKIIVHTSSANKDERSAGHQPHLL